MRERRNLERETGIEPARFRLGKRPEIENKEHSEFRHLFPAIEFIGNSQFSAVFPDLPVRSFFSGC